MAFHLGSLGFLTPFKFEDFETQVKGDLGELIYKSCTCEVGKREGNRVMC